MKNLFIVTLLSIFVTIMCGTSSDSPTEPENSAPVIVSITANPSTVTTGNTITLTAIATDSNGDSLTYTWETSQGTFSSTIGSSVQWTAPNTPGNYSVTCTVNDGKQTTSKSLFITVAQTTGTVNGYVYEKGTTTPISGVIVSILSKSDTTPGDGYYELTGITLGTNTIETEGDSAHISYSQSITVNEGDNSHDIFLTSIIVLGTLTDIDGNTYQTAIIGNQEWMAENLKVTSYRNGDAILNVTDNVEWSNLSTGAYSAYEHSDSLAEIYGILYNWFAINDSRNIAPDEWHVPSDEEWKVLIEYNDGILVSGGKLKEVGTTHWNSPNVGATNESGFTALPGGTRHLSGQFGTTGSRTFFWSSTVSNNDNRAWYFALHTDYSYAELGLDTKTRGKSVRLVRNK